MNNINKQKLKILYEVLMAILSVIVVIILIIDLSNSLAKGVLSIFNIIDNIILVIFIFDYLIRFYIAENKAQFFKSNIIDLISIIPFNSAFQGAKALRITKLLRFTKLFKAIKLFRVATLLFKFKHHIDKFIKTNNFHYMIYITISTLIISTIGMHYVEGISYSNAIWWSFVTITTVGYGDISPHTQLGRILASLLMLIGIGFVSMLTGTIATFFLNKKCTSYKDHVVEDIKNKLDDFEELSIEDINDMYKILVALKKE
ncbi:MAG: potassium channel family protein [Bacillota bacterium]|nr:potassium channel family protein [Bacillota bacterium]